MGIVSPGITLPKKIGKYLVILVVPDPQRDDELIYRVSLSKKSLNLLGIEIRNPPIKYFETKDGKKAQEVWESYIKLAEKLNKENE